MASALLTLACLAATVVTTNAFFLWWSQRSDVGFYDDPCGPTLYRMRAQGVPDLPNSVFIPPPRTPLPRRTGPLPPQAGPANTSAPPQSPPQVPTPAPVAATPRPRPPPPRRRNRPATARSRRPQYPLFLDPYSNRPIDPLLALALDLDPFELPDGTTAAPAGNNGAADPPATGSRRPRRVQRQAPGPGAVAVDAGATAPRQSKPRGPPPPRRPRYYTPECYCDSIWDCSGLPRKRGGRYDRQCDNSYDLVCCCR